MNNLCLSRKFGQRASFLVLGFWLLSVSPGHAQLDVCSEGVGLPPFLSAGANPNLLLFLDNSGSMLDMAYLDQGCVALDAQGEPIEGDVPCKEICAVEGTYTEVACIEENGEYLADPDGDGVFDAAADMKYVADTNGDGTYDANATLISQTCYDNNYLYDPEEMAVDPLTTYEGYFEPNTWYVWEGSFAPWYKTYTYAIRTWSPGEVYPAKTFVKDKLQLYFTVLGGTADDPDASDGINISGDTGVIWEKVDWTWRPNTIYAADSIVSYQSMLFRTAGGGTSGSENVWDDGFWTRIDGGQFVPFPDDTSAKAVCSGATGTKYTRDNELCLTEDSSVATDVKVTAFAARGNFLNWAVSSKFDIQKKILTGGKFNPMDETDPDDGLLIAESRGCAGKRFVKEVNLDQNGATRPMVLTMAIRGYNDTDWLDTLDNTGRVEFFQVREGGYADAQQACQDAIDVMLDPHSAPGLIYTPLEGCLGTDRTNPQTHATIECWQLDRYGDAYNINVTQMISDCDKVYTPVAGPRVYPWDISLYDSAYVCYGVYNSITPWRPERSDNDLFPSSNLGYIGRCWREWEANAAGLQCLPQECPAPYVSGDTWKVGATYYSCQAGQVMRCTNYSAPQKKCLAYEGVFVDSTGAECIPGTGGIGGVNCGGSVGYWMPDFPRDASDCNNQIYDACIEDAVIDYCKGMTVPEVVDPSDLPTQTDEAWNLPGSLIDRGLDNAMGPPIAVIKGYISYELPAEQLTDHANEPDGPRGILYESADSLRIGAMAFNDNGSDTECDETIVPPTEAIEKFCPDPNKDGAKVVALIDNAMYIHNNWTEEDTTDDFPIWEHYKVLIKAINDVRATAWTPLAEAMFNAIGYYAQRTDMRLHAEDFTTATLTDLPGPVSTWAPGSTSYPPGSYVKYPRNPLDASQGDIYYVTLKGGTSNPNATHPTNDPDVHWTPLDPGLYWCQPNHVLLITEGSSTADINPTVSNFLNAVPAGRSDSGGDGAADAVCTVMNGSTYLDDLTYFAQYDPATERDAALRLAAAEAIYTPAHATIDGVVRQDITTHIVATGSVRDDGTDTECNPRNMVTNAALNGGTTAYKGGDAGMLRTNLEAVFSDILSRASAGSAASVISSSRSGSGAVYQAIFWPEITDNTTGDQIEWVGDVHALFLDERGFLFEDTPDANGVQDHILDPSTDLNNNNICDAGETCTVDAFGNSVPDGQDKRVVFYFSELSNRSRACLNITGFYSNNNQCPNDPVSGQDCSPTTGDCRELTDLNYLWSAKNWLADVVDPNTQRTYNTSTQRRYIFTWQDLDNDGIVDSGEQADFTTNLASLAVSDPDRGNVADDFAFTTSTEIEAFAGAAATKADAAQAVIDWIRGEDLPNLRSRQFTFSGQLKTWRLGDVIHSTPTVVARPAEAFHFVYKDPSYALFAERYANRRQMVYFGGNDGMLHAINAGFYQESTASFCKTNTKPCDNTSGPELGAEMWGYIPYNLIPHLKCLADPNYAHKFYVDQRPKVFDVQIFAEDLDHPGGWGTILVGSMRFGGAPVIAGDIGSTGANDQRRFTSSYFILDITNPEVAPVLLGEITSTTGVDGLGNPLYADMGYSFPSPAMTVQRDDDGSTNWYLILGNGPQTLKGTDNQVGNQPGRIAVLPLAWLKGEATWAVNATGQFTPQSLDSGTKQPIRIPNARPSATSEQGGVFLVPGAYDSFISDLITVDFDVEVRGEVDLGGLYRGDAIYFGTVDGDSFAGPEGSTYWDGGGRLFRLVTKIMEAAHFDPLTFQLVPTRERSSLPSEWAGEWATDPVDPNNPIRMLIDAKAPITAAPSVGWDGMSFWVYFGTGRFFDRKDKTDLTTNRFFGIREPFDITAPLTCADHRLFWPTLSWDLWNNSLNDEDPSASPGNRGLLQTDNIIVSEYATSIYDVPFLECAYCVENLAQADEVSCSALTPDTCFPTGLSKVTVPVPNSDPPTTVDVYSFNDLQKYIAGTSCNTGIDGWFREVHEPRERHLGQAALLGGLLTYTGYQPWADLCRAEGRSFLYGIHYQTGTAWYESVFGTYTEDGNRYVKEKLSLGTGLATTPSLHVGSGENEATAFIQTSTGEIIEIGQDNLPLKNVKSGRVSWKEEIK